MKEKNPRTCMMCDLFN